MYTAVLLASLGLLIGDFTWPRGAVWVVLLVCLLSKLAYEERLLTQRFNAYPDYLQRTKRLIPWVY